MLKDIFTISPEDAPLAKAEAAFAEMLSTCEEMVGIASGVYWGASISKDERREFYKRDVRINKLERDVRADVVTHLSGDDTHDVPYSLMLMSLVKDIERLGDQAKNLCEVPRQTHGKDKERVLPDDENVKRLREVATFVEGLAQHARQTYADSDSEKAKELTLKGRDNAKALDAMISDIAASDYSSALAVDLALGARFYKRIQAGFLNLLSAVLMPLHKLDYFDEDAVPPDLED